MVTATQQRINVLVVMAGQEGDVKSQIAKEYQTVLTVVTVMLPLTRLYVPTALKAGWVLGVEILVYTESKYRWTVAIVSVTQDGWVLVAIANVQVMAL